jgi:membrane protein
MSDRPAEHSNSLILIAATTILILTAQRYFQTGRLGKAHAALGDAEAASGRTSAPAISQPRLGPHPTSPFQIPWEGWKRILWRTYARINEDRLLAIAAGVVFFGLLAIFPAITALVSFYGLFANPSTIAANLQSLALMLPEGSFQIVQDQIARVLAKGNTELGATFLFGLGLALWSANAGVKALIDALNVAYGEREKRSFLALNLLSLAFTIGGIIALLLMVAAVVAFPLVLDHLGLGPQSKLIFSLARWPLLFLILWGALGLLYRFGPSREHPRWEWLNVGTLAASFLWIVGSSLLSWYLSNFANYSATYGSLGAAIGLMTWMWMSAIIVLWGAELNSEIEREMGLDTTVKRPDPLAACDPAMTDRYASAVPGGAKNTSFSNQH